VICTGNTVVEAVHRQLPDEAERAALLDRYGLRAGAFALVTIHRPENTDDRDTLAEIFAQLRLLPVPALAAVHPRTAAAARRWDLQLGGENVTVVPPLPGRQFLGLAHAAGFLVTDSGGIQEEATVLGKPIIVVRRSTERPEAFEHHAQLARPDQVGELAAALYADLDAVSERLRAVPCPYGDGTASARIVTETLRRFG
jgi:UDP-N-acetylglucosamine 2-epimerase (non-hydrolysing)